MANTKSRYFIPATNDNSPQKVVGEVVYTDPTGVYHICGLQKGQTATVRAYVPPGKDFDGSSPAAVVGLFQNGTLVDDDEFMTSANIGLGTASVAWKLPSGTDSANGFVADADGYSIAITFTKAGGSPTKGALLVEVEVADLAQAGAQEAFR